MSEFEIREAYLCMLENAKHVQGPWLDLQLALLLRIAPEEAAARMRILAEEGKFEIWEDGERCEGQLRREEPATAC